MDADITKINSFIRDENKIRKEKFQRVHREITKQEYIIFHALMIGATAYSENGDMLWDQDAFGRSKKRRGGLLQREWIMGST